MPFQPVLAVRVEYQGATFIFSAADEAASNCITTGRSGGAGDIALALARLFVEGCKQWEGVIGADGEALACTPDNRAAFLLSDKTEIADAYLSELMVLAEGKAPRPKLPTASLPPEMTAAGPRPMAAPGSDGPEAMATGSQ